jgi:hypothetical protein
MKLTFYLFSQVQYETFRLQPASIVKLIIIEIILIAAH